MKKTIQSELNALKVAVSRLRTQLHSTENRISVLEDLAQRENEIASISGVDAEMEARVRIAVEKSKKRRGLKY